MFLSLSAVPATSKPQQEADCVTRVDTTWSPGLSSEGASGTITSKGETGEIRCDGPVQGERQTRVGTAGVEAKYGTNDPDTCASGGEGAGSHSFTIPTARGTKKMTNNFTFTYHREEGLISGSFEGDRYSGGLTGTPLEGDCVSKPVTKIHLTFVGDFHS